MSSALRYVSVTVLVISASDGREAELQAAPEGEVFGRPTEIVSPRHRGETYAGDGGIYAEMLEHRGVDRVPVIDEAVVRHNFFLSWLLPMARKEPGRCAAGVNGLH